MAIEITSRHVEVAGGVKEFARRRAEWIMEEFPRVENVHVILDGQGYRKMAEIVVQGKNCAGASASGAADEMLAAVDRAAEKAVSRLRKASKKLVEKRVRARKAE